MATYIKAYRPTALPTVTKAGQPEYRKMARYKPNAIKTGKAKAKEVRVGIKGRNSAWDDKATHSPKRR